MRTLRPFCRWLALLAIALSACAPAGGPGPPGPGGSPAAQPPGRGVAQPPGPGVLRPPGRPGAIQWIDVHVHPVGGRAGRVQDYAGAVNATIAVLEREGLRAMVLMPPPQVAGDPPPFDWDAFEHAVKRHPGRLAFLGGGGSLNPMLHDVAQSATVSESVKRRFEQTAVAILKDGAVGFGEMAAHHLSHLPGHPYEWVAPDHPLLLLLADIAARHDVVIDLHLDPVPEDMKTPEGLTSPNPPVLKANMAAFERLLEHNRKAKIVWAHAGSDFLGTWTAALSRRLLAKHPNLYMSLRMGPGRFPDNHPLAPGPSIKPDWLRLFQDFPNRFVLGGDQFILSPAVTGMGPGLTFAQRAGAIRQRTRMFLEALPPDLARKIGYENAIVIYKLRE